jgi:hypothetical protein
LPCTTPTRFQRFRKQAGDNIVCWRTGAFAFSGSGESARQGQGKQLAIRAERAPSSVRFKWADKKLIGEKALTNSRFEGAS